jgi:hypothetical protein
LDSVRDPRCQIFSNLSDFKVCPIVGRHKDICGDISTLFIEPDRPDALLSPGLYRAVDPENESNVFQCGTVRVPTVLPE